MILTQSALQSDAVISQDYISFGDNNLEAIFNSISEAVICYDLDLNLLWSNIAADKYLSCDTKFCKITGRKMRCPEFFSCSECPITKTLETDTPQQCKPLSFNNNMIFSRLYPAKNTGDRTSSIIVMASELPSEPMSDCRLKDFSSSLSLLSPREKQVMQLVSQGKANKVIARDLNISIKTVEIHRSKVMQKLKVDSVAQLVRNLVAIENSFSTVSV